MTAFNFLFRLDVVNSGMVIRFFFISFFVAMTCLVNGQTVIVNPDGTHSVVVGLDQPGTPKIVVNPNGSHSIIHTTGGAHSIVIVADGRHSVVFGLDQPGAPKIIVHPDGKHSVVHSTGTHSVMVGPNGAHVVMVNQLQAINFAHAQDLLPSDLHCQLAILLMLSIIR